MKGHAAFAVPLHASDFGAAEPSRAVDPYAACAKPHGGLDCALHRSPECNSALELLRNRLGYELGIEFRLPDLDDIDDHIGFGELGDFLAQLLDIRALFADHHAGPRRLHGHAALL